ncbi:hypothetical protein BDR22DRAFT_876730 [Usnea florida]
MDSAFLMLVFRTLPLARVKSLTNGRNGKIQYRGYSVADLVGKVKFVATAFLLIRAHLPSDEERAKLEHDLAHVPLPDQTVFNVIQAFSRNARL